MLPHGRGLGDILIPMEFCAIQGGKHNRKYTVDVIADKAENVFVVPIVESPLCYLKSKFIHKWR